MTAPETPADPIEPILEPQPEPEARVPLKIEDIFAVGILALLALLTFGNVLVRYLTDQSFAWTEEISIFLLVVLTLVAGSTAFIRHHHIRIELFADRGPPERRRRWAIVAHGFTAFFFALLTVLATRLALDEFQYEDTSPAIGVPTWWYTIWLPLLSALITLRTLGAIMRLVRGDDQ
jgi:TRAP-type C4-dicarboxylate transport system permease small subunit